MAIHCHEKFTFERITEKNIICWIALTSNNIFTTDIVVWKTKLKVADQKWFTVMRYTLHSLNPFQKYKNQSVRDVVISLRDAGPVDYDTGMKLPLTCEAELFSNWN